MVTKKFKVLCHLYRYIYDPRSRIITSLLFTVILSSHLESFARKQEYGLTLLVSTDDKVNAFLKDVLAQIQVRT